MKISSISTPEIYNESSDFRFFINWFEQCLSKIQFDTTNFFDLYDPLRCKSELLWMLAWTMGYKYDDRLPPAYNRLVLLYFMSMIRHKGSKDGVTLAAECNLAQFSIIEYGKQNDILYDRLEDKSIPANSAYVTPHTDKGYIDIVYFSTKKPIDACIEYVRPIGMYVFQNAGVRMDARTKVSVDARLTDTREMRISIGPTHVGHYRREDYARMQKMRNESENVVNRDHIRNPVYYRNSKSEAVPSGSINPGWRALYSLQLCNNEHVTKSLIDPIFSLGYGPQDVSTVYPDDYLKPPYKDKPTLNLRYDRNLDNHLVDISAGYTAVVHNPDGSTQSPSNELLYDPNVTVVDDARTESVIKPRPAVNPIMGKLGDSIALDDSNTKYTKVDDAGNITTYDED